MSDSRNQSSDVEIGYFQQILEAPELTEEQKTEFANSILALCKEDDAKKKENTDARR